MESSITTILVSALEKIGQADCKSPVPYGGGVYCVTHDMASDACDPSLEGRPIEEEPSWERCGECAACIANQALSEAKKLGFLNDTKKIET